MERKVRRINNYSFDSSNTVFKLTTTKSTCKFPDITSSSILGCNNSDLTLCSDPADGEHSQNQGQN